MKPSSDCVSELEEYGLLSAYKGLKLLLLPAPAFVRTYRLLSAYKGLKLKNRLRFIFIYLSLLSAYKGLKLINKQVYGVLKAVY